jgi:hypothetical protein
MENDKVFQRHTVAQIDFFYIESCQYSMFYTNCSLTWNEGNMSLFDFLSPVKNSMFASMIFIYS